MQAAYDLRSGSRLQPRLQPMHSGRPPLRPCTVPAKTSFSPRHTHASMTAVNVSITRTPRLCLRGPSPHGDPAVPPPPLRDLLPANVLHEEHSVPASQGRIAGYRIGRDQSAGIRNAARWRRYFAWRAHYEISPKPSQFDNKRALADPKASA